MCRKSTSTLLLLAIPLLAACGIDHGLEPNEGIVRGTVTYVGTPPANTESVQVVIFEKYMTPDELLNQFLAGTLPAFFQSDPLRLDTTAVPYSISVPRGRYEWVAAVWLPKGQSLLQAVELGAYHRPGDAGERSAIVVEARKELTGIDIVADFHRIQSGRSLMARPSDGAGLRTQDPSQQQRRWQLR